MRTVITHVFATANGNNSTTRSQDDIRGVLSSILSSFSSLRNIEERVHTSCLYNSLPCVITTVKKDPTTIMNQFTQTENQPSKSSSIDPARYKTEMCRPLVEYGHCRYGDKCQFAHGTHELRDIPRHPKYKTDLCNTFHTVGFCPYGSRCHFIHDIYDKTYGHNKDEPNYNIQQKLQQVIQQPVGEQAAQGALPQLRQQLEQSEPQTALTQCPKLPPNGHYRAILGSTVSFDLNHPRDDFTSESIHSLKPTSHLSDDSDVFSITSLDSTAMTPLPCISLPQDSTSNLSNLSLNAATSIKTVLNVEAETVASSIYSVQALIQEPTDTAGSAPLPSNRNCSSLNNGFHTTMDLFNTAPELQNGIFRHQCPLFSPSFGSSCSQTVIRRIH